MQLELGVGVVALVVVAGGAAACGGPSAPRGAANRVGGAASCLPADLVAPAPVADDDEAPPARRFRFVTRDGRTHLCADRPGDAGPVRDACWTVDLGSGAVTDAAIVVEAGAPRQVTATTTAAGLCAEGYCVPGVAGTEDDGTAVGELAVGTDGTAVLIAGTGGVTIFDPDRRPRLIDAYRAYVGDDGPSASPGEPHVIGDVIFIGDFDAGPHADVHAWRGNGTPIGPIGDPAASDYDGQFELDNGAIAALSDHEVAFVEYRVARVLVFDTRTLKTAVWKRRLAPVPGCTPEATAAFLDSVDVNLDTALEDGTITPACLDALAASHGRFATDAGVARTDDGALVALARDRTGAALLVLDGGGAVARELPLPICAR